MDFELWDHGDQFQISEKPIACPACSVPLVAIEYGDTGVAIDCCNGCRGVWLDAGEFGRIIAHLSEDLLATESSEYLRASLEEAKELITGPESFVSEWKDFVTVLVCSSTGCSARTQGSAEHWRSSRPRASSEGRVGS